MHLTQWLALVVFVGAYILIATERIHRVAAALGGAALMLALGFTDGEAAYYSHETGIDWNVIFLLFGMMMIVGVIKTTGLFEALAIYAAKRARGRPYPLMVLLAVITAVAAPHRDAAFAAGRELIDQLKATTPIWKHQLFGDGESEWVGLP